MPKRSTTLGICAGLVLGATAMFAATFVSGCYGHQCDASTANYGGDDAGLEGQMITPDIWVSTAFASLSPDIEKRKWLTFPHARTWVMHPKPLDGREIIRVTSYVSPDQVPNQFGTNFTQAAGNLAEYTVLGSNVFVSNATCADYYVQVSIEALPPTADGGAADGGADGAASLDAADAGD